MINANELRIGNVLIDPFYGTKIIVTVDVMKSILSGIEYKPVPLTEEILLKCGFRKTHATFVYAEDMAIGLDLDWVGIFCERMQEDIELDCPKSIHQLQNLYFALTGQELNTSGLI